VGRFVGGAVQPAFPEGVAVVGPVRRPPERRYSSISGIERINVLIICVEPGLEGLCTRSLLVGCCEPRWLARKGPPYWGAKSGVKKGAIVHGSEPNELVQANKHHTVDCAVKLCSYSPAAV
jgi:hypothetical protein